MFAALAIVVPAAVEGGAEPKSRLARTATIFADKLRPSVGISSMMSEREDELDEVGEFLPAQLVRAAVLSLGEQLFDRPPVTEDQLALLSAGGTCDPNPAAVTFGLRMRALADVLPAYNGAAV